MISASVRRSRSMPLRKAIKSFMPKSSDETSKAMPVVSMISVISFPLMVVWRRKNIITCRQAESGFDDTCQLQKFRADGEPGAPGRVRIDFEAHFIAFLDEVDDATAAGEAFHLADRQNFGVLEFAENLRHSWLLGGTDKQNLASLAFGRRGDFFHGQLATLN